MRIKPSFTDFLAWIPRESRIPHEEAESKIPLKEGTTKGTGYHILCLRMRSTVAVTFLQAEEEFKCSSLVAHVTGALRPRPDDPDSLR